MHFAAIACMLNHSLSRVAAYQGLGNTFGNQPAVFDDSAILIGNNHSRFEDQSNSVSLKIGVPDCSSCSDWLRCIRTLVPADKVSLLPTERHAVKKAGSRRVALGC